VDLIGAWSTWFAADGDRDVGCDVVRALFGSPGLDRLRTGYVPIAHQPIIAPSSADRPRRRGEEVPNMLALLGGRIPGARLPEGVAVSETTALAGCLRGGRRRDVRPT
jgi:hypothetical protein